MLHRVKPFLGCVASPQNLQNELRATEFQNKASVTKLLLGGTN
jgi:hypothetical protein